MPLSNSTRIFGFADFAISTWGNWHLTFAHLFQGRDAGLYGYLWSKAYSADMFYSKFKPDPLNKEEGRRYRRIVLEPGGSKDEMEMLEEFLERAPNNEAFAAELGISAA